MFPTVENVNLVPVAEMERRFAAVQVASTNQHMQQYLFEPLVEWARQVTEQDEPIEAQALVQTIVIKVSDYATELAPAGQTSLTRLLPYLLREIVHTMLDDEHERWAVLEGVTAAFTQPDPATG